MRPTQALIDLAAIRHNLNQIRKKVGAEAKILAVVKANAYGHGAIPVSRAVLDAGADSLAVAIPEEGLELREAGFREPILVLGLSLPEQASTLVNYNLTATVCTIEMVRALSLAAHQLDKPARVMIKLDSGMHRIGLSPHTLLPFLEEVVATPGINLGGLFTHLATADAHDKAYANQQLTLFGDAVKKITSAGFSLPCISAGNSATIVDLPLGYFNTVRPGIILYGLEPSHEMHHRLELQPAMQLKTKIVYLKEVPSGTSISYGCTYTTTQSTVIATLPIGYADGYNRQLSNLAPVLIGGQRYRVAGRVCMDQILVDLGPNSQAHIGDEVVLFGKQGKEEITVTELADLASTINYELVCDISARVPRIYKY